MTVKTVHQISFDEAFFGTSSLFAGVEPFGIFDDLSWTTIEFVRRYQQKLRRAPKPVPRGALSPALWPGGRRLSR